MLWFNPMTDVGPGAFRQLSSFLMLEGPSGLIGQQPQVSVVTLAGTRAPTGWFSRRSGVAWRLPQGHRGGRGLSGFC